MASSGNIITWEARPSLPAPGKPITGAAACDFVNSVYVLGGFGPSARPGELRHEVFDVDKSRWLTADEIDTGGEIPSPRAGHSATRIHGSIYVFGGQQVWPKAYMDELFSATVLQSGVVEWMLAFDPSAEVDDEMDASRSSNGSKGSKGSRSRAGSKNSPPPDNARPHARAWHAAASLTDADGLPMLVVCGGEGQKPLPPTDDTDGADEAATPAGGSTATAICDDLWAFDPQGRTWEQKEVSGASPLPRAHHSLVPVAGGTFAVLFGGKAVAPLEEVVDEYGETAMVGGPLPLTNDVFVLDVANWTWSAMATTPSPLSPPPCCWHSASVAKISTALVHECMAREGAESPASLEALPAGGGEDDAAEGEEGAPPAEPDDDPEGEGAEPPTTSIEPAHKLWSLPGDGEEGVDGEEGAAGDGSEEVLVVFGGAVDGGLHSATVHALDRRGLWHVLPITPPAASASTDTSAAAAATNELEVLIGDSNANTPPPRFGAVLAATNDGESLLLCGGADGAGSTLADAHMLNLWAPAPPLPPPVDNTPKKEQVVLPSGKFDGFTDGEGRPHGQGTCEYENGDVYEGEWVAGKRQGQGKCTFFVTADVYEGAWSNDAIEGEGSLVYGYKGVDFDSAAMRKEREQKHKNEERRSVKYEGGFKRGVRHGGGSVTFSDGAVLSATWVEGSLADAATAIAALTTASGSVVEGGVWEGDVLVSGVERSDGPTAQVYTGGFDVAGLRTGQGTCTYRDGSSYVGEWRNGKRNGKGDFKDATTNEEYSGKWVGDMRCGSGLCTYAAGHRYEGLWQDGLRHGEGSFFKHTGEAYTGEWRRGRRHGHGVHTDTKGKVVSGSWQNDRLFEEDPEQDGMTGTMAVPTDDFMSSTLGPKESLISDGSVDGMDVGKIGLPI